jgi:hypothetical protein
MSVRGTEPECLNIWAVIDALGDEDPSPQTLAEIGEHFANCATCTDAEQSLEEVLALYRSEQNIPVPPQVEQRLLDCLCGGKKG